MNIAIIGGGIGGLTTAIALQKHGIAANVYESAARLDVTGKGIWVPTNAMLVFERLGIAKQIAACGVEIERIELSDQIDGLLQAIDLEEVRSCHGHGTISILRSELQRVLAGTLESNSLHLGKRCIGVQANSKSAEARFDDGSVIEADIVVGADGIRSMVRETVTSGVKLRHSGQTTTT